MRGKLIFGAGAAVGYLLGTRAGRERFDQITGKAKRFWENNTVQEAAGVVQEQAERLYDGGKKLLTDQAHKMREHRQEKHEKQEHMRSGGRNEEMRGRAYSERDRKEGWQPSMASNPAAGMNPPSMNPTNTNAPTPY